MDSEFERGLTLGYLIGMFFAIAAYIVIINFGPTIIRSNDYCADAFGDTELVLFEDGSWDCRQP